MTLIDMGTSYEALTKEEFVKHVMEHSNNGEQLKHIFLTHPDVDHYNIGQFGEGKGKIPKVIRLLHNGYLELNFPPFLIQLM